VRPDAPVHHDVPVQRRGPLSPTRPLTGGNVPDDVLAGLAGALQAELHRDGPAVPRNGRGRQAAIAMIGAFLVLCVLLAGMAVLGLLL
jgi:hypothetical protein